MQFGGETKTFLSFLNFLILGLIKVHDVAIVLEVIDIF